MGYVPFFILEETLPRQHGTCVGLQKKRNFVVKHNKIGRQMPVHSLGILSQCRRITALLRRVFRQQPLRQTRPGNCQIGGTLQHPYQVVVRVQPVLLRRFNHTEYHCAPPGPIGRIGKQKVLMVHHEGLNTALSTVVAHLQPPVLQIPHQVRPLFSQIVQRFAKSRLRRRLLRFRPRQQCVKKGFGPFLPLFIPFFRSQIGKFFLQGKQGAAVPLLLLPVQRGSHYEFLRHDMGNGLRRGVAAGEHRRRPLRFCNGRLCPFLLAPLKSLSIASVAPPVSSAFPPLFPGIDRYCRCLC